MDKNTPAGSADPLWQTYERSVGRLLTSVNDGADVRHNQGIPGRLSGTSRQIDVWVTGSVAGVTIKVAVECKRHKRIVDVGSVDQFIGKLLDIGADRGVLYSYSGFSRSATMRCARAMNPNILPIALVTPQVVHDLQGVPGYPADMLVQDVAPQWVDEVDEFAFAEYLKSGAWNKFWS